VFYVFHIAKKGFRTTSFGFIWSAVIGFQGYNFGPSQHMSTSAALSSANKLRAARLGASGLVAEGAEAAQMKIAAWLFGCATWVFSMVMLGGITRLTRSGLSMTDWKFTGNLPPMTKDQWEVEFDKYKQSPEYKR
jgi:cytochrome c oxidase assembly protein subunit 15